MWLEKKRRPNIWWAWGARVDAGNGVSSLVKRVEVGHRPKAVEGSVETRTRAETGPSWKEAILGEEDGLSRATGPTALARTTRRGQG